MNIHYVAVLVAAIASMIISSIWYGPLFGEKFKRAMGMDKLSPEEQEKIKKSMTMSFVVQFIASLVMFFVLAWYIRLTNHSTLLGGIGNGFGAWLGFALPIQIGDLIWGGKKTLFWISATNMLVTLLVAGAIIGAWQ